MPLFCVFRRFSAVLFDSLRQLAPISIPLQILDPLNSAPLHPSGRPSQLGLTALAGATGTEEAPNP